MIGFYVLACLVTAVIGAVLVGHSATRRVRITAAALCAVGGLAMFALAGGAARPAAPMQERLASIENAEPASLRPDARAARARAAVRLAPTDPQALRELGYAEAGLQAWPRAIRAFERALQAAPSATAFADLADVVVARDGGVTPPAESIAQAALQLDPENVRARRILAIAASEGEAGEALEAWSALLESLEETDGRRRVLAAEAAARLSAPRRGPGEAGAAPFAQSGLEPGDVDAMISGMIANLNARLDDNPEDLQGWLALARAHAMRSRWDEAAFALESAGEAAARPAHNDIVSAAALSVLAMAQNAHAGAVAPEGPRP